MFCLEHGMGVVHVSRRERNAQRRCRIREQAEEDLCSSVMTTCVQALVGGVRPFALESTVGLGGMGGVGCGAPRSVLRGGGGVCGVACCAPRSVLYGFDDGSSRGLGWPYAESRPLSTFAPASVALPEVLAGSCVPRSYLRDCGSDLACDCNDASEPAVRPNSCLQLCILACLHVDIRRSAQKHFQWVLVGTGVSGFGARERNAAWNMRATLIFLESLGVNVKLLCYDRSRGVRHNMWMYLGSPNSPCVGHLLWDEEAQHVYVVRGRGAETFYPFERYVDFVSEFVAGAPKKKKGFRGGDAAAISAKGVAARRGAAAKASASEDVPCEKAASDDGVSVAGLAVVDEMANSAGTEMLVGSGVSDPATSSSTKQRCCGDALDDPECAWPIEDCFDEAPV
ncbi:MAG: hypothetical protein GY914_11260, partial [Prochlorococcus sp.]|nr:hypothetical protein [Prochlorococcus sp.]